MSETVLKASNILIISTFFNFRGKEIKMVNSVLNRVDKFGEGVYKYNSRGFVIQNAREEKFQYSARGYLVRSLFFILICFLLLQKQTIYLK